MARKETKIQWTTFTWNPWHGCTKVSPGCKFCYMYRDKDRYGLDPSVVVRSSDKVFNKPLHINDSVMIFTCSWSDFFIEEADGWREKAWEIIKKTPHITYQILTKRPERIHLCLPKDWGSGYDNVWMGISAEDQNNYSKRLLALINTPAKVRFISAEPLLSPIKLNLDSFYMEKAMFVKELIHWVIVGGESGNDTGKYLYRECSIKWIESIVEECRASKVPVFVKQLGTHLAKSMKLTDRQGGSWDELPSSIKIRQYPKV